MSETTPTAVRKQRPVNGRDTRFKPKNAGKPVGAKDRRRVLGQLAAQALEGQCWDVVAALLKSPSWRAREAAAKIVLAYSLGLPRQSVNLTGFGDLAVELAAALKAAREARALNGSAGAPAAPLSGDRVLVRAELLAAEVVSPGATSSKSHGATLIGTAAALSPDNAQLSEARGEPADPDPEPAS